ncbi:MAG: Cation transport ATPase, partial [Candidatus Woesebacteria bacterium GW2011_GWB1_38_5]
MDITDTETVWWNKVKEEVLQLLSSKENGLSSDEVKARLKIYGENTISKGNKNNALNILLSQFKNWLTLILIFAAIVSFARGEHIDSVVILSLVILSSFFGFVQEYKAEKTLLKLKKLIKHKASVYRDGRIVQVDSAQIVPGDIVELVIGDIVPADIRLIGSEELLLNESVLTGESMPVEKDHEVVIEKDVMISDMKNMLFMGTS